MRFKLKTECIAVVFSDITLYVGSSPMSYAMIGMSCWTAGFFNERSLNTQRTQQLLAPCG